MRAVFVLVAVFEVALLIGLVSCVVAAFMTGLLVGGVAVLAAIAIASIATVVFLQAYRLMREQQ